ncbi:long-chain-fatty-acid--CoA ligase [Roseiconus lacunae]|uniref:long-chain-fatty-acid--CoA ligase n=1 Tax=Roseiconus lacunae TaxID=2605694 RepID=UPI001E628936|nr:long-chain-fatty-acid--CoA ligase [Roseiconus lacunae]MCD0458197.1 long-chain-fatty-acid--CoA ligase [Roseiconus lacunae]
MNELPFSTVDTCDTLCSACHVLAKTGGDRDAFVSENRSIRFDQLQISSHRVANALRDEGCDEGTRVAVIGGDAIASYELLFGCAMAGCVLVPVNWRLSPTELIRIIEDSEARLLMIDTPALDKLRSSGCDLPAGVKLLTFDEFARWRDEADFAAIDCRATSETPLVQIYTSGTTGVPKGVVLAHRSFFQLRRSMRSVGDDWMGLHAGDRLLLTLPQFHIGGLWWAIQGYLVGATGYLMPAFTGWQAIELIERHRITQVPMVPAMIQFSMAEPTFESANFSSVRGFLYGGSPISSDLLASAQQAFSQAEFFQIYGLTETGNMAVCLRPEDHNRDDRRLATGRPLPGVSCKIIQPDGTTAPANAVGEVWLKSPSVMLEYWKRPEETADTLSDGWIRTGDAGYLAEDGCLYVCDRLKDMIIYAGENLFPAEIETVLRQHDAIGDVAVIGVPDPKWGESPKAFIELRHGSEKPKVRELLRFAKSQLAEFKVPKSFEFVDQLPRNPSGKVLKKTLRQPYWENQQRKVN